MASQETDPGIDAVWKRRCQQSLTGARRRRGVALATRKRRIRVRGSWLSLAAAALAMGVIGAGAAIGARGGDPKVVLKRGDRGTPVAKVQRRLDIAADGIFGHNTAKAVRHFQRRRHLMVDAVVGPQTRRSMGLGPFVRSAVHHPRRRARNHGGGGGGGGGGGRPRLPAILKRIAQCESNGNPRAIGGGGRYRGKYQFDLQTWHAVGGRGDPARASEAEQDRRALKLYRLRGTAPWPVCGRR